MKKLLTATVASAFAFLAIGAANGDPALPTGTSFESLTAVPVTVGDIVNTDDTGNQDGEYKYWYSAALETDDLGVVTNDVAGAGVSRPDAFADKSNTQALQIETTSPLFRTVFPNSGAGTVTNIDISVGEGLYLDTLVKFTPADSAFATNSLDNADKIAISYVAYEPEHPEDVNDVAYTNFVIRAGYIGANEISQTNYLATITNGTVDLADWHRLTVRTLTNIDGHNRVGFKVYVDEKELVYLTDDPRFATAAGVEFVDATL